MSDLFGDTREIDIVFDRLDRDRNREQLKEDNEKISKMNSSKNTDKQSDKKAEKKTEKKTEKKKERSKNNEESVVSKKAIDEKEREVFKPQHKQKEVVIEDTKYVKNPDSDIEYYDDDEYDATDEINEGSNSDLDHLVVKEATEKEIVNNDTTEIEFIDTNSNAVRANEQNVQEISVDSDKNVKAESEKAQEIELEAESADLEELEEVELVAEDDSEDDSEYDSEEDSEEDSEDDSEEDMEDDDEYEYEEVLPLGQRIKKFFKTTGKVCILFVEIALVLTMSLGIYMLATPNAKEKLATSWLGKWVIKLVVTNDDYGNILDEEFDRNNTGINDDLDESILKGYTNIALFGLDSRYGELGQGVRSDTIIVVSINEKTKEIKLCSVYRDNWLRIINNDGTSQYGKVNAAYAFGGPESAVATLNSNFDLNIKDYASVNFYGIANIIDKLDGLDMNITKSEMYWINQYLTETRKITGMEAPDVTEYGYVHLSGLQVTAFCRIRYVTFTDPEGNKYNDDFGRTARQRFVISELVKKAKNAGIDQIMNLAQEVFSENQTLVQTSIPYDDLLDMIPVLMNFNITGSTGFPTTLTCPDPAVTGGDSSVVAQGFAYNVKKMHQFLFGDMSYVPSNTVLGINDMLIAKTHVEEVTLPEDATEDDKKEDETEEASTTISGN